MGELNYQSESPRTSEQAAAGFAEGASLVPFPFAWNRNEERSPRLLQEIEASRSFRREKDVLFFEAAPQARADSAQRLTGAIKLADLLTLETLLKDFNRKPDQADAAVKQANENLKNYGIQLEYSHEYHLLPSGYQSNSISDLKITGPDGRSTKLTSTHFDPGITAMGPSDNLSADANLEDVLKGISDRALKMDAVVASGDFVAAVQLGDASKLASLYDKYGRNIPLMESVVSLMNKELGGGNANCLYSTRASLSKDGLLTLGRYNGERHSILAVTFGLLESKLGKQVVVQGSEFSARRQDAQRTVVDPHWALHKLLK